MEPELKQRLIGASVLTFLAALLIPVFLSDHPVTLAPPPEPEPVNESHADVEQDFNSSLQPVIVTAEDLTSEQDKLEQQSAADHEQQTSKTQSDISPAATDKPSVTDTTQNQQKITNTTAVENKSQSKNLEQAAAQNTEQPINDDPIGDFIKQKTEPEKLIAEAENSAEVKTSLGATRAWVVQLGSFSSEENANGLHQKLQQNGFQSFIEPVTDPEQSGKSYRVRVGPPSLDKTEIAEIKNQIKSKLQLDGYLVEYP